MERPEYNKLRKMAKTTPGLIVDEAQNMMRVSLYDNGELKKVVVVMKCDSFLQSKSNIEKIMLLSSSIEDRKNKDKNKYQSFKRKKNSPRVKRKKPSCTVHTRVRKIKNR